MQRLQSDVIDSISSFYKDVSYSSNVFNSLELNSSYQSFISYKSSKTFKSSQSSETIHSNPFCSSLVSQNPNDYIDQNTPAIDSSEAVDTRSPYSVSFREQHPDPGLYNPFQPQWH